MLNAVQFICYPKDLDVSVLLPRLNFLLNNKTSLFYNDLAPSRWEASILTLFIDLYMLH